MRRYMPLASKLAARYRHSSEPLDDLLQVASLGLVKAIDRFEPDRGVAFPSFAVPTILGELKRHFRDSGAALHLPRGLQELVVRVREGVRVLESKTGHSPAVVDLASYLEADLNAVIEALDAIVACRPASLDAPLESGSDKESMSHHELIGSSDPGYDLIDASISMGAAVAHLSAADRKVFMLRFERGLTQRQIGEEIGISQMQVSRILRRVTDQLRDETKLGSVDT